MSELADVPRLKFFPVSFFAIVMGLAGLAITWHKAEQVLPIDFSLSYPILVTATTVFALILLLYATKALLYRAAVAKELGHPVQINFFPAISISLLLLSIAWLPSHPGAARSLWMVGAGLHLVLTLYILSVWIHHEHFEVHHINPAWFIPVVGNVLVPIAGAPLGFTEVSWFFFSVGMVFWLILFAIIMYRVLFHEPMEERLMPTFFILIAPPAVGFIAYLRLTGDLDAFARVLYYCALFLTLLLMTQVSRFIYLRFYLSWWAYSFPLAAVSIATLLMYELTGESGFAILSWLLISIVTLVVLFLFARTIYAASRRQICLPVG